MRPQTPVVREGGPTPSETNAEPSAAFTPDDIAEAASFPSLGPAYFASRRAAAEFMAPFEAEHFKPLIEKFADDFRDCLWADLETWLLSDTESNLQNSLRRMVDGTVNALLTGEAWALERYVLAGERYGDAPKVRAAIVTHCREQLAEQRIADLEGELAKAKEDLRWARERA